MSQGRGISIHTEAGRLPTRGRNLRPVSDFSPAKPNNRVKLWSMLEETKCNKSERIFQEGYIGVKLFRFMAKIVIKIRMSITGARGDKDLGVNTKVH